MTLYPMALKIDGRRCVVVGAGAIAERKIASLMDCGADVTVVSPEITAQIQEWADTRRITLHRRPFEQGDAAGALVVIAATNISQVNQTVRDAAHAAGALINVVDVPDLCDFYVPASVTRGDLQISVSTGGAFPALAKKLRIELEKTFGPEYETYIGLLARLRGVLKERVPNRDRRNQAERDFLSLPALELIAQGRVDEAERVLMECLEQAEGNR